MTSASASPSSDGEVRTGKRRNQLVMKVVLTGTVGVPARGGVYPTAGVAVQLHPRIVAKARQAEDAQAHLHGTALLDGDAREPISWRDRTRAGGRSIRDRSSPPLAQP